MLTEHLFKYSDLEPLEKSPLSGNYKILVVGTFNGNISGNNATWFYGRPENEFWCLFPRMLSKQTLHPVDRDENILELTKCWKKFCKENKIIIVDLFKDIRVALPDYSDKHLEKLSDTQYESFDFEKAFSNCNFRKVIFTWIGMKNNTLTALKKKYIRYFEDKGSKIVHLVTPSNAYSKPRIYKLTQWSKAYNV